MARRLRTYAFGITPGPRRRSVRLPKLSFETMTPRQRTLHDKIAGKRGKVGAPYQIWLYSPELCERVEAVGAYLRWDSAMAPKYRELSLLLAARFFDAQYSWNAHAEAAVKEGIRPETLAAIAERREPPFNDDEERLFYTFCMEVLENHFVKQETFDAARKAFGPQGIVDIIGAIGNFSTLAMLLNTFEVDLQPERPPPYPDIRGYVRRSVASGDGGQRTEEQGVGAG
jgi:4-carboxymuconolactone decarboxylase